MGIRDRIISKIPLLGRKNLPSPSNIGNEDILVYGVPRRMHGESTVAQPIVHVHVAGSSPAPDSEAKKSSKAKGKQQPASAPTTRTRVIKPYVYNDEQELEDLQAGKAGTFKEKGKAQGILSKDGERWDKERMRAMLLDTNPEKLPMLTVTRKGEFYGLVRASAFDEAARLGHNRDLRKQSFISMYIKHRDTRAPSAFPEEGDSRKEVMKQLEYMAQEEQDGSRGTMPYGGHE